MTAPGARVAVRATACAAAWAAACATVCVVAVACGGASPPGPSAGEPAGVPYLQDASFRRAELVASLVNPSDGYAQLRLAHYATGDAADWDLLPEWNPAVEPIAARELDAPGGASLTTLSPAAAPLALPATVTSEDDPALVALGEEAFRRYPVQLAAYFRVALSSRTAAARYGLWVDEGADGSVGGLVRAQMADGTATVAVTCSTCHAAPGSDGALVSGLPNARLEVGAARLAAATGPVDPALAQNVAAWGPGRLDVTTDDGTEPVRIPDLRPIRWLTYLHADATVANRDRTALAIRIETLLLTSQSQTVRPPRVVALALAAYLASLAGSLPEASHAALASPAGAALFAERCAQCHAPPSLTGPPVPLAIVGTDPHIGESAQRGTGTYRVPSLRGVGTRGPLLHDGTVPSLDAMFDPSRPTDAFAAKLHGTGAVPGHAFGLDLDAADRGALLDYLRAL
jgi:mono/diheme cytochrome c family protein